MADFILNIIADNSDAMKNLSETNAAYDKLATSAKTTTDIQKKGFKESADAAKASNEAIKNIPKNTEKVVNEFSKLRNEIREYKAAALEAGENSPIGQEFLNKAAEATDRLGDLNSAVKRLSSDTSALDAVTGAARGIAAGFSIAQGAAAVFGSENKDLEKELLKVQGAMAILNGLTEVQNLLQKESAVRLALTSVAQKATAAATAAYSTVVGLATGQISLATVATNIWGAATKAALGPIGLLVGAVTAVGGAILLFSKNTKDSTESLDKLNKATETYYKFRIRIAEIQGDEDEAFSLRKKQIDESFKILEKERALITATANERGKFIKDEITRLEEINEKQKELANEASIINAEREARNVKLKDEANKKIDAITEKLKAKDKKDKEDYIKLLADREKIRQDYEDKRFQVAKKHSAALKAIDDKKEEEEKERQKRAEEREDEAAQRREEQRKRDKEADKQAHDQKVSAALDAASSISQATIDIIRNRIEAEADLELRALDNSTTAQLDALQDQLNRRVITQKQFEASKAAIEQESRRREAAIKRDLFEKQRQAAIIEAVINGALAVVKALPAVPLAIAAGIAAAAQIALIASQPTPQFHEGGYTGDGDEWGIAGAVHNQEFVSTKKTTKKHRPILEALHTEDYSRLKPVDLAPLLEGTGISLSPDVAINAIQSHSKATEMESRGKDEATMQLLEIKKEMKKYFGSQYEKPIETKRPDGSREIRRGNTIRIIRPK